MKVISVKESVFSMNDKIAEDTRRRLKENKTFLMNVTSAPGSGKTTLLIALLKKLKKEFSTVAMDVDIETDVDARRLMDGAGVETVQIHNGGLCHVDAEMVRESIDRADFGTPDLIVLENIGNLVCPAEFDTGAHLNMMLLSVPEGDDKPLKYPLMFQKSDLIVVTKTDVLKVFDFDKKKFEERIKRLNPNARVFYASAKTGDGIDELQKEISKIIKTFKGENNNGRDE